ncbi:transcription factor [Sinorhizobium medicae]|nr:transcription factor [Sinorhizobium medicae]MDX0525164.1 transcription factor [Sinorhizobium medicae]MDX0636684.1 transcription factor [Sinorhizobium medicae]MDX0772261.1 transcription factor [Sinorhizobium medicae]MDX0876313.1 transcription factor [Sinorhizobium medicae]
MVSHLKVTFLPSEAEIAILRWDLIEETQMSEPQLSVRSSKARDLAHALARRTGQPINRLVEQALEHYDLELRQQSARTPIDVLSDLMTDGRRAVPAGTTSAHDDFYDEHGLPR